jgi:hypothetical protein
MSKNGVLLFSQENQNVSLNITAQGGFSFPLETGVVRTVTRKNER